jgi:thioredoxin reductase (NADPH)
MTMNEDPGGASETSQTPPDAGPPQLTREQLARIASYGARQDVRLRDVVFRPGDPAYDLILIEVGRIEIVSPAGDGEPEAVVASYGPGGFLGELNLLTGQTAYLTGRVAEPGRIRRISQDRFRQLMADDPEISDILLRAFLARRDLLRASPAVRGIEMVGSAIFAADLSLHTYAARQLLPHLWLDADSVAGRALMRSAALDAIDLPAIVTPDQVVRQATPGRLAGTLGLPRRHAADDPMDLTIIGSGPAGLAAAVSGSSEGLNTLVLDAEGVGGHAAASSLIENHLGFPDGISGLDLAQRAARQALKFGMRLSIPSQAAALDTAGEHLRVVLADGTGIDTRTVLIATGVRYRVLPLARWAEFEGAGIYYAATELEARACAGQPVTVIGGADPAGQAALYLASRGNPVTVAVRGPGLSAGMSAYLADRLRAHSRITIRPLTEITKLDGTTALEAITFNDTSSRHSLTQPCRGLFCFIGFDPATAWNHGVILDANGYVRTGVLDPDSLAPAWALMGRPPLPFETSVPAVFAAGDVRAGSVKRIASAINDGANAARSIHAAIGVRL